MVRSARICTPLVPVEQYDDWNCCAYNLRAIANYFFIPHLSIEILSRQLKADPDDGTDVKNILKTAASLGLKTNVMHPASISSLCRALDSNQPVLCATNLHKGHYITAIGYDKNHIIFFDPLTAGSWGFLTNKQFLAVWHDTDSDDTEWDQLGIAFSPKRKRTRYPLVNIEPKTF